MMSKSIIKQTLHYLSANVVAKGVHFFSLIFFTRIVSPSDYGFYSVFIGYASIFAILLTLNAHTAVSRYFYEGANDGEEFVGATIISTVLLFVASSYFLLINIEQISEFIQLPPDFIILFIPFAFIEFASLLYIQVFQPVRKTKEIAILIIAKAILSFVCSLTLVIVSDDGKLSAMIYGYILGNFLAVTYAMFTNRPLFKLSVSFAHLKYIYSYTLPLIVYSLTTIILTQSDKILLAKLSSSEDAGLYSLASNIGMIIVVLYGAMLNAWTPSYFEGMNANKFDILKIEVKRIFFITTLFASALALFGSEIAIIFFPSNFHGGLILIPILVFGYFLDLGWQVYGRHFGYQKKTHFITIVGVVSSFVSIASNYVLIPEFGYFGAALASVLAYSSMLLLTIFTTKYITKVHPYPFSLMYRPLLLLLMACAVSLSLGNDGSLIVRLMLKLIVLIFIAALVINIESTLVGRVKSFFGSV
jgi:O-antigen/teichoic acid export membrane protein